MVVVEIHVPLTPVPDPAEGAYPFPWIDDVEDFLAAVEDEGGAEVFDEGVEDEDRYVFFVTGAEERALLEVASRVAALPGVPGGAFAVVSDEPGEEIGRGRRVELPAAP